MTDPTIYDVPAEREQQEILRQEYTATFVKQTFGAVVATIRETDDALLEIQKLPDGTFSLTVHNRVGETDRFEDMSIKLDRKHFAMLGSIAVEQKAENSKNG